MERAPGTAEAPNQNARDRRTTILRILLLVALVVQSTWMLNVYKHWKETNSSSRVYLTLAIVEHGSFQIDQCLEKYGDTLDKAVYNGHRYTDKAPGTSFLFVPVAWVLQSMGVVDLRGLFYGLRLICITLPAIGFWLFVLPWFRQWCGREDQAIAIVAAGALGTNFFIYSTQLFAHVPAACLLFLSFLSARRAWTDPNSAGKFGPALLAGALSGAAFLNDYIVMLAVAPLGIATTLAPRPNWRQPIAFALGLAPAIAVWMAYNWLCFDHPLRTGFYYHALDLYGKAYRSGFLGIQKVDMAAAVGMLLSPARGMLFLSPFLVLAPIGWWRQIRGGADRADGIMSAVMFACLFFFAMTTVDWRGGWGVGTRYLVPAVPFLLVGVAAALRDRTATDPTSIMFAGLASVGILLCAIAGATVPLIQQDAVNPLYSLDWPLARDGYLGPHLLTRLGVPWLALSPYLAAIAIGLFLVIFGGPARTTTGRVASVAASAVLTAALMAWQSQIPETPNEQLATQYTRIESLAFLGFFDECAREMVALSSQQAELSATKNRSEPTP